MNDFVLLSPMQELMRSDQSPHGWIDEIELIHGKGHCDTFSLMGAEVYETKCNSRRPKHHVVGPMLELASVGRAHGKNWQHAGWLCTLIQDEREIQSFCSNVSKTKYGEYSIYTGVHIVAENCLHSLRALTSPIQYFLEHQSRDPTSQWLEFALAFMTHDLYQKHQDR